MIGVDHAVSFGDALGGVAQKRVIQTERLRELAVCVSCVDADGKVGDIEPAD
jgi:hypothetical protein